MTYREPVCIVFAAACLCGCTAVAPEVREARPVGEPTPSKVEHVTMGRMRKLPIGATRKQVWERFLPATPQRLEVGNPTAYLADDNAGAFLLYFKLKARNTHDESDVLIDIIHLSDSPDDPIWHIRLGGREFLERDDP